jgi:hypothetical protein
MPFNKFFWMEISLAGNGTGRKILAHWLKPILRLFWDDLHGVKRNMAASFLVPWKKSDMFWILILQLRQRDLCESFDFWITNKTDPEAKDIICNLCIWTRRHQLEGAYRGSHETVKIGGRTYEAIIETPADQPAKTWKTLFVIDTEPRSQGSLELQPFMEILIERGLAKLSHFLATAELGNEVAYGKGRTIVQKFSLR